MEICFWYFTFLGEAHFASSCLFEQKYYRSKNFQTDKRWKVKFARDEVVNKYGDDLKGVST